MNLGATIKRLRIEKFYSQKDFSKEIDISQTALSQIEGGYKQPSAKTMAKVSKVLGVPEPLIYFLSFEPKDVPKGKEEAYNLVYPMCVSMMKKILI